MHRRGSVLLTIFSVLMLTSNICRGVNIMCKYNLEIENGMSSSMSSKSLRLCGVDPSFKNPCIFERSKASNDSTVRFSNVGQYVSYNIATSSQCSLQVASIMYSNDGPADTLSVLVNNDKIGEFNTSASLGDGVLWNVIRSSNQVGDEVILSPGQYEIKIMAITANSVELDKMILLAECEDSSCPHVSPFVQQHMQEQNSNRGGLSATAIALIIIQTVTVITLVILVILGLLIMIRCKRHQAGLLSDHDDPNEDGDPNEYGDPNSTAGIEQ